MLITTGEVYDGLAEHSRILVDLRGEAAYRKAHIPGAIRLPPEALNDPESPRSALWSQEVLRRNLEEAGIGDEGLVVAYDDSGLVPSSKLYWVLRYLGRGNVAVMDGGFAGWKRAGLPVSTEGTSRQPGGLSSPPAEELLARREDVLSALDTTDTVLVDARTPDEFAGRSATALREGHIPGAVNINWEHHVVDLMDPRLRPLDELRALYEGHGITPDKQVITYCRSGARSSHTFFVLSLLGYPRVRNYEASWLEWGNEPDLPVALDLRERELQEKR
jgi:thiosulfate/3-mercaptopyruvate sulfurtransferase